MTPDRWQASLTSGCSLELFSCHCSPPSPETGWLFFAWIFKTLTSPDAVSPAVAVASRAGYSPGSESYGREDREPPAKPGMLSEIS
jgi:hypothetical protein